MKFHVVDMETYERARCTQQSFERAVVFTGSHDSALNELGYRRREERRRVQGKFYRILTDQGVDVTPLI